MALWQRITCDSLPSHGLRLQRNRKKNRCRAGVDDDDDGKRSMRMVDIRSSSWNARTKSPLPPSHTPDQGYNTLLSSFTSADIVSALTKNESESVAICKKPTKKKMSRKTSPFEKLTDDAIAKVFSYLTTDELCASCPAVCRRWYSITWGTRSLWTQIEFGDAAVDVDKGLRSVFKLLSRDFCCKSSSIRDTCANSQYLNYSSLKRASDGETSTSVDIPVEEIVVYSPKNNCTISDRGLLLISRKCTSLRSICLASCPNVTDIGLSDLVMACHKLARISCPGCSEIALNISRKHHRRTLQYLDVSDCSRINDYSITTFLRAYGADLHAFFARKCPLLTDEGVMSLVKFSPQLRDVSLNECIRVTDASCRELSKLSSSLRYVSLSKCRQVSDDGLKYLLSSKPRLRYLNMRGCPLVSDDGMHAIATSVGSKLKALDVGKCDVTDEGLKVLSENCTSIHKLALRGCHLITDAGIANVAYNCMDLIQLNIIDCPNISREGYLYIRRFCLRCLIQHSNANFY